MADTFMIFLLILFALTFLFSFLISLVESILLGINGSDIEYIRSIDKKTGTTWQSLRRNLYQSVTVTFVVDTLVLILGTALLSGRFVQVCGYGLLIPFSLFLVLTLVIITEVVPKYLGLRYKRVIAQFLGIILVKLMWFLRPFRGIFRFLSFDNAEIISGQKRVVSEITTLAHAASLDQQISAEQEMLIKRSLQLSNITASEIMVKREIMITLSSTMSLKDALIRAHLHNHTRFPLTTEGRIDEIRGYVNFKDIVGALEFNPNNPTLAEISRSILFVSPSTPLSRLLGTLTKGYHHIAVVINESGETMGMVTLEDVLESLVGEVEDEYDLPPDFLVQLTAERFRVGGGTPFSTLHSRISESLPDWDLTIDEWIQGQCSGSVPENYEAEFAANHFRVRRLSRGRVYDVIISVASP
ncbi:MAG: CBS domain-containing protein [Chitinispirillaceae bacterium]